MRFLLLVTQVGADEYATGHTPLAVNIPLGQLRARFNEPNRNKFKTSIIFDWEKTYIMEVGCCGKRHCYH